MTSWKHEDAEYRPQGSSIGNIGNGDAQPLTARAWPLGNGTELARLNHAHEKKAMRWRIAFLV